MQIFSLIMAGGGGTRFWPLSRQCAPKQLLNLSGNDIMINETILRNKEIIPEANTYIITNSCQGDLMKKVLLDGVNHKNILIEPEGKNTAACIGYSTLVINKRHGDSIVCIFPSDAYIGREDEYLRDLKTACEYVKTNDVIVTLGIKPSYPATGYGYIKYNLDGDGSGIFHVEEFKEKPSIEKARTFIAEGRYLWNSGIIITRTNTLLKNMERFLPKLYKQLKGFEEFIDTESEEEEAARMYSALQSLSVDFGILERSDEVMVIPSGFEWNDVGSWDTLGAIYPPDSDGNIIKAEHTGIDTKNSIIYGSKLVTTIGIDGLVIVNTDDALLICPKSRAQEVKSIVELLKRQGKEQYI